MRWYSQGTDSSVALEGAPQTTIPIEFSEDLESTGGECPYEHYIPLLGRFTVLGRSLSALRKINDDDVAKRSERLISIIQKVLHLFDQGGYDVSSLPPLQPFFPDDGSVLFEWIFPDYRIGFSIERESKESGWYLVTNSQRGEISASGYLLPDRYPNVIRWLLTYIFEQ